MKAIERVSRALNIVGMGGVFVLILWVTTDVAGRYLFNKPIVGSLEITELLMAVMVFSGLAYTGVLRAHIRIDTLVGRFPERVQTVASVAGFFLGVGITLAGGHWVWPARFVAFFAAVYGRTMVGERKLLEELFGDRYRTYAANVPALLERVTTLEGLLRAARDELLLTKGRDGHLMQRIDAALKRAEPR